MTVNESRLDGRLGTVTDDEYFDALLEMPKVFSLDGSEVDVTSDIVDERGKNAE